MTSNALGVSPIIKLPHVRQILNGLEVLKSRSRGLEYTIREDSDKVVIGIPYLGELDFNSPGRGRMIADRRMLIIECFRQEAVMRLYKDWRPGEQSFSEVREIVRGAEAILDIVRARAELVGFLPTRYEKGPSRVRAWVSRTALRAYRRGMALFLFKG